ncbi:amidase 1 isoform X1 [Cucumis sativus]|uniref:Amidase domain-containing protein n=2 Tax=Cucumis sativus TaxID=3659 RepID=A0A0A0LZ24_CUCSA|nr:amidase 1 isoform X1 [Cucumis sativus]
MAVDDYGAFIEKFLLQMSSPSDKLPLSGLTFAVKDIFDIEGYVAGFGNPEWLRTHPPANQTAPAVLTILRGGATCIGKTIMDEMAFSINGENFHYGTPQNPHASDRIPGGSSSGSGVAVAAKLVDFSLGTDTGGSVRVPASYCGILGFRPSHGVVSTSGVIPMTQSFDTVGWFARDSAILKRVGWLLLQEPEIEHYKPTKVFIAEDCFKLLSNITSERLTQAFVSSVEKLFGGHLIKQISLGKYVEDKVPSLKHFMIEENDGYKHSIPSLAALVRSKRFLQRHEFNINHGEWVRSYHSHLGPGISERILEFIREVTDENIDLSRSIQIELREALAALLEDFGVLAIPTVPGPPPKLNTDISEQYDFRAKAFSLLTIAAVSGVCQVSVPLGLYNGLPVSISLLAKHGADGFLLNLVDSLYSTLKEEVEAIY